MIIGLTPVYNGEDILPEFFEKMDALDPGVDFHIFVTNNCIDKTNELIDNYLDMGLSKPDPTTGYRKSWDYHPDFVEKIQNPYANLAIARQWGYKAARKIMGPDTSYTHLYLSDDDTWPLQSDALSIAMTWTEDPRVDILGGSYLRYFHEGKFLASKWVRPSGEIYFKKRIDNIIMFPAVTSGGFMVIPRDVVLDERLNFWPMTERTDYYDASDDFSFCLQARKLGYGIGLDGMIRIEHKHRQRKRSWEANKNGSGYVDFRFEVCNAKKVGSQKKSSDPSGIRGVEHE